MEVFPFDALSIHLTYAIRRPLAHVQFDVVVFDLITLKNALRDFNPVRRHNEGTDVRTVHRNPYRLVANHSAQVEVGFSARIA